MCLENTFLTQCLADYRASSLKEILHSFENALYQVENFYCSLHISREQVMSDQMLKDREILYLVAMSIIFLFVYCMLSTL